MYKGTSASLQRKHRVIEVRKDTSAYISDDDLILTADNMNLDECQAERNKLLMEKTRAENELAGAKAAPDPRAVTAIGHRLQSISGRLSLVGKRIKHLNRTRQNETLAMAVREVLPPEWSERVYARQNEILAGALSATPDSERWA